MHITHWLFVLAISLSAASPAWAAAKAQPSSQVRRAINAVHNMIGEDNYFGQDVTLHKTLLKRLEGGAITGRDFKAAKRIANLNPRPERFAVKYQEEPGWQNRFELYRAVRDLLRSQGVIRRVGGRLRDGRVHLREFKEEVVEDLRVLSGR